jgi:AraC-like DNA-binding protein
MVCSRCKMVVSNELEKAGLHPVSVELGEIEVNDDASSAKLDVFSKSIREFGFELIDDKKSRVIEKIKGLLIQLFDDQNGKPATNLSVYLSAKLHYDYSYLSNLFSEVEGTTIEKFYISLRVEKIKELLVYDELSLAEIADKLGYSSAAYLSSQFKQVTGLTPTFYKSLKEHKRRNIEDL